MTRRFITVLFFPLAAGPPPRRELTLMPRGRPLGIAAGASFSYRVGPHPHALTRSHRCARAYLEQNVTMESIPFTVPRWNAAPTLAAALAPTSGDSACARATAGTAPPRPSFDPDRAAARRRARTTA